MTNEWESQARLRKARKLAALLRAAQDRSPDLVTVERLAATDQPFRDLVARQAGVNPPSQRTWDQVLDLLREAAMPPSTPADR